jgi:hypothetical protein
VHEASDRAQQDKAVMSQFQVTANLARTPAAAKLCLWFFIAMLSISIAYITITGELNGDFYGVPLSLSGWEFTCVSLISLAPYIVGYLIYLRFTRTAPAPTVRVGNALLGCIFFAVMLWFIVLAVEFGVGVLGRELYDAPALIKPLIQISNRINPFYLGVFFIVGYQGSKKVIALGIIFLITLGLLRAGLGVFLYVFLALVIRNHQTLRGSLRRHLIKLVLAAVLLPTAASQLYALRSEMRETQDINIDLTMVEIVTARLVGRLSSISNTAFIFQISQQFQADARALDPWYFQRQTLAPLLGVGVIPEDIPERLLINVHGGSLVDVSFMTGVPGNLAMAWFIHPVIALINAITLILMIWLSFFFANKLDLPYRNEVCFMLLLYPLTSGVGNEFSFIAVSMVALIILIKFIRLFRMRAKILQV